MTLLVNLFRKPYARILPYFKKIERYGRHYYPELTARVEMLNELCDSRKLPRLDSYLIVIPTGKHLGDLTLPEYDAFPQLPSTMRYLKRAVEDSEKLDHNKRIELADELQTIEIQAQNAFKRKEPFFFSISEGLSTWQLGGVLVAHASESMFFTKARHALAKNCRILDWSSCAACSKPPRQSGTYHSLWFYAIPLTNGYLHWKWTNGKAHFFVEVFTSHY